MTLEQVMTQVRIDRTVVGIKRRSWSESYRVIPGRGFEEDVILYENSPPKKYAPNLFDICATDWEPIR